MREQHLGGRLTATPPLLELLHEDLADDDIIVVHEHGGEDDSHTVFRRRHIPGRERERSKVRGKGAWQDSHGLLVSVVDDGCALLTSFSLEFKVLLKDRRKAVPLQHGHFRGQFL